MMNMWNKLSGFIVVERRKESEIIIIVKFDINSV